MDRARSYLTHLRQQMGHLQAQTIQDFIPGILNVIIYSMAKMANMWSCILHTFTLMESSRKFLNADYLHESINQYIMNNLGHYSCDEDSHSDFVEFSNYMPVDRKFDRQCGTIKDLKMKSDRKFFRVTFRSNDRYDATGFHATYQFNKVANHLTIRNVRSTASYLFAGILAYILLLFLLASAATSM